MVAGRSSAGINKTGGKNVNPVYKAVKTLTSYVGGAAREIRDIPTAVGNFIPGSGYGAKGASQELAKQVKEAAAAVTAKQKGTGTLHYDASGNIRGDNRKK
jgi:hypothetical protein